MRILVTSALPYANGPIHIGHLVEYIQTDIFVRALRLLKRDVIYCCADDTHGTPIEISASKQGISPEELIKKYFKEHTEDFSRYHIRFDSYYTTNSSENEFYVKLIYERLKKKGMIYKKSIELTYCNKCQRFLPDRYVKGKCPNCSAPDQYGDVCEKCNSAYTTTELIEPYCAVCGSPPVRKVSEHLFFRLSTLSDRLKEWLVSNKELQPEIRNQIMEWVKKGLEDWCISRDGPYFGFRIPDEKDKYFYVWLDAPVGYIASTAHYCKQSNKDVEDYWMKKGSRIIHFIGKDIIYFHFLFWPAVLMAAELNLPSTIVVHGFLTVNNEKMSKSRGTFLTASDFAGITRPEYLRYYYASNLTKKLADLDLNIEDFRSRINNELIGNIANFFYRVLSFAYTKFDGRIIETDEPVTSKLDYGKVLRYYEECDFRSAVKEINSLCRYGNSYMQENEPWITIKDDRGRAHKVISSCANLVKDINILLSPILPEFAEEIERQMNLKEPELGKLIGNHSINKPRILYEKIEHLSLQITDPFSYLDMRVARIVEIAEHPDGEKLYVIKAKLDGETRQIVAGLRTYYKKEELLNRNIVLVCNLKPVKLRGVESRGMLLAAESGSSVEVLFADKSRPNDRVSVEDIPFAPKQIVDINEFLSLRIATDSSGTVTYSNMPVKTGSEKLMSRLKNAVIR